MTGVPLASEVERLLRTGQEVPIDVAADLLASMPREERERWLAMLVEMAWSPENSRSEPRPAGALPAETPQECIRCFRCGAKIRQHPSRPREWLDLMGTPGTNSHVHAPPA